MANSAQWPKQFFLIQKRTIKNTIIRKIFAGISLGDTQTA